MLAGALSVEPLATVECLVLSEDSDPELLVPLWRLMARVFIPGLASTAGELVWRR